MPHLVNHWDHDAEFGDLRPIRVCQVSFRQELLRRFRDVFFPVFFVDIHGVFFDQFLVNGPALRVSIPGAVKGKHCHAAHIQRNDQKTDHCLATSILPACTSQIHIFRHDKHQGTKNCKKLRDEGKLCEDVQTLIQHRLHQDVRQKVQKNQDQRQAQLRGRSFEIHWQSYSQNKFSQHLDKLPPPSLDRISVEKETQPLHDLFLLWTELTVPFQRRTRNYAFLL